MRSPTVKSTRRASDGPSFSRTGDKPMWGRGLATEFRVMSHSQSDMMARPLTPVAHASKKKRGLIKGAKAPRHPCVTRAFLGDKLQHWGGTLTKTREEKEEEERVRSKPKKRECGTVIRREIRIIKKEEWCSRATPQKHGLTGVSRHSFDFLAFPRLDMYLSMGPVIIGLVRMSQVTLTSSSQ